MDTNEAKIYTAVLITSIIIGSIVIYFIISLRKQQRINSRLYTSKIQGEITTLENERTRIAGDLHDELGPLLSAIRFKLSSVDTKASEDDFILNEASEHIVDIIHRLRDISNDLMPNTLLRKGLTYAIEEFIYKVSKHESDAENNDSLRIQFRHDNMPELRKEVSINIYRMVQEIIHNTIKHANATKLIIDLKVCGNGIILSTEDNGIGFNYNDALDDKTGLGLRSLASRCDVMKGDFYIESHKDKGTIYTIELPIL